MPVHCLDRLPVPDQAFSRAKDRVLPEHGGSLNYHQVDVSDNKKVETLIAGIASEGQRLDGLIAGESTST